MKIALAADHAGFRLKEEIKKFLEKQKVNYQDFGTYSEELTDYMDWAVPALKKMSQGEFERAILICGTGLGMTILANKFSGVRATPCYDLYTARMSREHNDSNVLVLGGRITAPGLAREILKIWLNTKFQGERHKRRLDKLTEIEKNNLK